MESFDMHYNGIDFLVEYEDLPGKTRKYVARPLIEDIDPKLKVTTIVYDNEGFPEQYEAIERAGAVGMLYDILIRDLFIMSRNASERGIIDILLDND